ncbi:MAG: hypothetical protein V5A62_05015 [Haloarculaceae archaeon]
MPAVPYVERSELPEAYRYLYDDNENGELNVCRALGSEYLWDLHARLAPVTGLDRAAIRAVGERRFEDLSARQEALAAYATAFAKRAVEDAHHGVLSEHLYPEAVVGVTMIASHFLAIAHVVDALDVDPEGRFAGWSLENG